MAIKDSQIEWHITAKMLQKQTIYKEEQNSQKKMQNYKGYKMNCHKTHQICKKDMKQPQNECKKIRKCLKTHKIATIRCKTTRSDAK